MSEKQSLNTDDQRRLQIIEIIVAIVIGIPSLTVYLSSPSNLLPVFGIFCVGIIIGYIIENSRKGPKFGKRLLILTKLRIEFQLSDSSHGKGRSAQSYSNIRALLIANVVDAGKNELANELRSERWDI